MKNASYPSKRKPYGMKDGGRVHANPNLLGLGVARDAGAALAGRQRQVDTAIEQATNTVDKPITTSQLSIGGGLSARRDGAVPPADMLLRQRRGMKDGGPVKYQKDGGKVKGPGGPTDDKAGLYNLSNKEYVLPADTTAAIGIGKLDAIRNATHTFVDESKRGMVNGGSEEEKRRRMVKAGGSEVAQGTRPETRNNVELAKLQKPILQSIGEGIGEFGGATARGIGTAARTLEDGRKATLSIANNLPGAIAAPIATAASSFGADVRTGFTGQKQAGTEYAGKPLFGGAVPSAVAAPLNPVIKPAPAQQPPIARQATPPIQQAQNIAQPQAPISAPPVATNNFGIGAFTSGSNRADGKQNVFAGEGSTGKNSVNPADFNAATARASNDRAKLTSLAVSGVNEGTTEGIDRAYRLAAGDPEATAAVEAAIKGQRLNSAALGGNKNAAGILNQQSDDATRIGIANIGAQSDQARLGIAQGAQDIQRKQFESEDAVNKLSVRDKTAQINDREKLTALRDQISALPESDPKRAKLVKDYNLRSGKNETGLSQKDLLDAFVQDSKARASNGEAPQDFQAFSRNITGQGAAKPKATPADITATAKKYGITEAEVKKQLGL